MKEWDFAKNPESPNSLRPFSRKRCWWVCSFEHKWQAIVANRSRGAKCPFCAGKRVTEKNSFAANRPKLLLEWDFETNSSDPSLISEYSSFQANWKCINGHKWIMAVSSRTAQKQNCPFCSGKRPTSNNNLAVLYPEISNEWSSKNGTEPCNFLPHSKKKVWWMCSEKHEWFSSIQSRTLSKSICHICSGYSCVNKPEYHDNDQSKKCHSCSEIKIVTDFRRRRRDNQAWSDSICKKCSSANVKKYRTMTEHGIAAEIVRRKRSFCNKHSLKFDLNTDWVLDRLTKIMWRCELTDLPFVKNNNNVATVDGRLNAISVDRINHNFGYTKDNVRFVLNQVNIFRQNGSDDRLYEIAEALLKKRKP